MLLCYSSLECRRRFFFALRCISTWNALPEELVSAQSVATFKSGLHSALGCRLFEFVDWCLAVLSFSWVSSYVMWLFFVILLNAYYSVSFLRLACSRYTLPFILGWALTCWTAVLIRLQLRWELRWEFSLPQDFFNLFEKFNGLQDVFNLHDVIVSWPEMSWESLLKTKVFHKLNINWDCYLINNHFYMLVNKKTA